MEINLYNNESWIPTLSCGYFYALQVDFSEDLIWYKEEKRNVGAEVLKS